MMSDGANMTSTHPNGYIPSPEFSQQQPGVFPPQFVQQQQQQHFGQQPNGMGYPMPHPQYDPSSMFPVQYPNGPMPPMMPQGAYMVPQMVYPFFNQQQQQMTQAPYQQHYQQQPQPQHQHQIPPQHLQQQQQQQTSYSNGNKFHKNPYKKKFDAAKAMSFTPTMDHSVYVQNVQKKSSTINITNTSAAATPLVSAATTATTTTVNGHSTPPTTASEINPNNGHTNNTNNNSIIPASQDTTGESSSKSSACTPSPQSVSVEEATTRAPAPLNDEQSTTNTPVVPSSSGSSISLPLLFNASEDSFHHQKLKFYALKKAKKQQLEKSKLGKPKEEEVVLSNNTPEATSSNTTATPTSASTPKQPAITGWAAMAQQAAAKTPKQSTNSSAHSTPNHSHTSTSTITLKKEASVPVSNVLESLGVVLLRFMYDPNYKSVVLQNTKTPKIIPRGLINMGNICFMSSVLQLLLFCKPFQETLNVISNKTIKSFSKENSKNPLLDSIVELYQSFTVARDDSEYSDFDQIDEKKAKEFGDSLNPTDFYKSITQLDTFKHLQLGQQEDAEEFLGFFLDALHEEFTQSISKLNDFEIKSLTNSTNNAEVRARFKSCLKNYQDYKGDFHSSDNNKNNSKSNNDYDDNDDDDDDDDDDYYNDNDEDGWKEVGSSKKPTAKRTVRVKPSPIRLLFGGQFRSILSIPKSKEAQSITLDPFQQIQLDISDDSIKSLEDAFKKISEVEEIPYKATDGSDVLAKKQTFIDKYPDVLIVHLKRFSFVNNRRIEKIRKKIEYSHDFNLPLECVSPAKRAFLNDSIRYKLIGVVYHHGINSNGGHYTVDVLTDVEEKTPNWIRIDDTNITKLEPKDVTNGGENGETKTAYILMYQKV